MTSRNRRTLLLAVLASATLIWSAIYHFDIAPVEMAWLFLYSAMGVFAIMLAAALTVALIVGLKASHRRWRKPED